MDKTPLYKKIFSGLHDFKNYKNNHIINIYVRDESGKNELVSHYMNNNGSPPSDKDNFSKFINVDDWRYPFNQNTNIALHFLDRDFVCFLVPHDMPKGIIISTGKKTNVIKNREFEITDWNHFFPCFSELHFEWYYGDFDKGNKEYREVYDEKVHQLMWSLCIICSMNIGVISIDKDQKLDKDNIKKIRLPNNTIKNTYEDIYKICIVKPKFYNGKTFGLSIGVKYREHIRRGHWRHYKNGHKVFINSYIAGDKRLGVITKDYQLKA